MLALSSFISSFTDSFCLDPRLFPTKPSFVPKLRNKNHKAGAVNVGAAKLDFVQRIFGSLRVNCENKDAFISQDPHNGEKKM